jgi:uncharacterized protein
MMACKSAAWRGLAKRFASMGRMAFSNYILESVQGTLLLYGAGFGRFARVNRQLWMRSFYLGPFGPLEWLWRSLTYQRIEPFRRSSQATM